jgi:hypothetical protein
MSKKDFSRAESVIRSCKTLKQLNVAKRYAILYACAEIPEDDGSWSHHKNKLMDLIEIRGIIVTNNSRTKLL